MYGFIVEPLQGCIQEMKEPKTLGLVSLCPQLLTRHASSYEIHLTGNFHQRARSLVVPRVAGGPETGKVEPVLEGGDDHHRAVQGSRHFGEGEGAGGHGIRG